MKQTIRYFLSIIILLVSVAALPLAASAQSNQPRLGIGVTRLEASPLLLQHLRLAEGEGLMIYGGAIIPFVDHFPKNTELYKLLTTRPAEVRV